MPIKYQCDVCTKEMNTPEGGIYVTIIKPGGAALMVSVQYQCTLGPSVVICTECFLKAVASKALQKQAA